jgi:hypothetical protein
VPLLEHVVRDGDRALLRPLLPLHSLLPPQVL